MCWPDQDGRLTDLSSRLGAVFKSAGCDGFVHAAAVDGGGEVGWQDDELVVLASVFKIPVMAEVAAQALAGTFSLTDRVRVTPAQHVMAPTGISALLDEVGLSARDLDQLVMSASDNIAIDVLVDLVGLDAVNKRIRDLGVEQTELVGGCGTILGDVVDELGLTAMQPMAQVAAEARLACRQV